MQNKAPSPASPTPPISKLKTWQIVQATLFIILVGVSFYLLIRFRTVIFILFIAIVISTAITPAVDWLFKRGIPRPLGVIVIHLLLIGLLAGFFWLMAPLILSQVALVTSKLPGYYNDFYKMLIGSSSYFIRRLGYQLPASLSVFPSQPANANSDQAALAQVGQIIGYANVLIRASFIAIAVFLLDFYWTLDGERTLYTLVRLVPASRREDARDLLDAAEARVGGFVVAQGLLSLTIAILQLTAYLLIGVPFAFLLAVFAGIMEAVPIFGPILGALPAVLLVLTSGNNTKLILIIVSTILIQFTENHFLVPRMVGKSVGVNPLVTLLAFVAFTSLFGFAGALVAVPLAAIIQLIIDRYVLRPVVEEEPEPEGRDILSLLRVEVQELSRDVRKQVRHKEGELDQPTDQAEDAIEQIANELDKVLEQTSQRHEDEAAA